MSSTLSVPSVLSRPFCYLVSTTPTASIITEVRQWHMMMHDSFMRTLNLWKSDPFKTTIHSNLPRSSSVWSRGRNFNAYIPVSHFSFKLAFRRLLNIFICCLSSVIITSYVILSLLYPVEELNMSEYLLRNLVIVACSASPVARSMKSATNGMTMFNVG